MLTPYEQCQRLTELLTKNTEIDWSFGYLGNSYGIEGTMAYQDDRTWYAFAAHPGRVGTTRDRIGGFRTSDLGHLVPVLQGAVALAIVQSARVSA